MVMCYLIYEIQIVGSHYFEPTLLYMIPKRPQNDIPNHPPSSTLTVFQIKGSPFGRARKWHLTPKEYKAAHLHVLLNCAKVQPLPLVSYSVKCLEYLHNPFDLDIMHMCSLICAGAFVTLCQWVNRNYPTKTWIRLSKHNFHIG